MILEETLRVLLHLFSHCLFCHDNMSKKSTEENSGPDDNDEVHLIYFPYYFSMQVLASRRHFFIYYICLVVL